MDRRLPHALPRRTVHPLPALRRHRAANPHPADTAATAAATASTCAPDETSARQPSTDDALNRAAFNLGQLVATGTLDETTVTAALTSAASTCGLGEREAARTIAALAVAVRRELIAVNPAAGQIDALPAAVDDEEPMVWQPEQAAQFLEHVKEDRLFALYELAAYAGLRRAELCGSRWSDLDPDGGGLTVRQTVIEVSRSEVPPGGLTCAGCGNEHVGRYFKPPKSRAGRRWVPLAAPAKAAVVRHRAAQENGARVSWGRLQRS